MLTKTRFLTAFCLAALAMSGCGRPRKRAEKMLARTGTAALRHQAALLYKDVFASSTADFSSLKEKQWPALFRVFEPSKVEAYPDGFALTLDYGRDGQSGLYIIPATMDVTPKATDRSTFEGIEKGIYWFHFRR